MEELVEIGKKARIAAGQLASLNTERKNQVLMLVADLLEKKSGEIMVANAVDLETGKEMGLKGSSRLWLRRKPASPG